MAMLRFATAECHRRLEKRLNIKERFSRPDNYRAHLEGMFGFQLPFEQRLTGRDFARILPDFGLRRKSLLLVADLQALGVPADRIARLAQCEYVPECQCEAAALGSCYVFEGATLGAQTLLPLVERQLGVTAGSGCRYLASYGADVSLMWRRFSAVVEAWCTDAARRATAAAAAVATFEALERWLCEPSRC